MQVMGYGKRLCVASIVGPTCRGAWKPSFHISLPRHHFGKSSRRKISSKNLHQSSQIYEVSSIVYWGVGCLFLYCDFTLKPEVTDSLKQLFGPLSSMGRVTIVTVLPWILGTEAVQGPAWNKRAIRRREIEVRTFESENLGHNVITFMSQTIA